MKIKNIFCTLLIFMVAMLLSGCGSMTGTYKSEDGSAELDIQPEDNYGDIHAELSLGDKERYKFLVYSDHFDLREKSESGGEITSAEIPYDIKNDTISFSFNGQNYTLVLTK